MARLLIIICFFFVTFIVCESRPIPYKPSMASDVEDGEQLPRNFTENEELEEVRIVQQHFGSDANHTNSTEELWHNFDSLQVSEKKYKVHHGEHEQTLQKDPSDGLEQTTKVANRKKKFQKSPLENSMKTKTRPNKKLQRKHHSEIHTMRKKTTRSSSRKRTSLRSARNLVSHTNTLTNPEENNVTTKKRNEDIEVYNVSTSISNTSYTNTLTSPEVSHANVQNNNENMESSTSMPHTSSTNTLMSSEENQAIVQSSNEDIGVDDISLSIPDDSDTNTLTNPKERYAIVKNIIEDKDVYDVSTSISNASHANTLTNTKDFDANVRNSTEDMEVYDASTSITSHASTLKTPEDNHTNVKKRNEDTEAYSVSTSISITSYMRTLTTPKGIHAIIKNSTKDMEFHNVSMSVFNTSHANTSTNPEENPTTVKNSHGDMQYSVSTSISHATHNTDSHVETAKESLMNPSSITEKNTGVLVQNVTMASNTTRMIKATTSKTQFRSLDRRQRKNNFTRTGAENLQYTQDYAYNENQTSTNTVNETLLFGEDEEGKSILMIVAWSCLFGAMVLVIFVTVIVWAVDKYRTRKYELLPQHEPKPPPSATLPEKVGGESDLVSEYRRRQEQVSFETSPIPTPDLREVVKTCSSMEGRIPLMEDDRCLIERSITSGYRPIDNMLTGNVGKKYRQKSAVRRSTNDATRNEPE